MGIMNSDALQSLKNLKETFSFQKDPNESFIVINTYIEIEINRRIILNIVSVTLKRYFPFRKLYKRAKEIPKTLKIEYSLWGKSKNK